MQYPKLFLQAGIQAKHDAIYVIETYFKLLKPKPNCTVMDVGCGPGNVTHDLLYPHFSNNINKLIGTDQSKEMIEFARKAYQNHPKISFDIMDVSANEIPKKFNMLFDHIVSFYCLHLICDHKTVLSNMYKMLKPGGNIFLSFMGSCIVFDAYKAITKETDWNMYLKNQQVGPPTQTSKQPSADFKKFLEEAGFTVQLVQDTNKEYVYTKEQYKDIAIAANMFKFPRFLEEKFVLYQMEYFRKHNLFVVDSNGNEYIHHPYTLITALASKPS